MKDIMKNAASMFGYMLLAGFMCIICFVSMKMIFNFVFTDTVGYTVKGSLEGSDVREELYTFYYEDGETNDEGDKNDEDDTKWAEYEEKGYTLYKYAEKTKLSKVGNASMCIISQILCILFVGSFVFEILVRRGYKDGSLVRSGNKKADSLKGLKIGLIASIPSLITFVVFVFFASMNKGMAIELYMLANSCFWPLLELALTSVKTAGDIAVWQFAVMFLLQLVIPAIAMMSYFVGYKDYQFLSKLLYKKKRKG